MAQTTLLMTKNDFEGIASAIITKYVCGADLDIKFYNYKTSKEILDNDSKGYSTIFVTGLKNGDKIDNNVALIANNFESYYVRLAQIFFEDFSNPSLIEFKKNATAYINWSWFDKKLYYGKNIDELSKYLGKQEVIDKIAERISNLEELVTEEEKNMLVFIKKVMTNNIKNKKYDIKEIDNKKFAVTYAEVYEIELANYILSQEKDIEAVVIFNMNTKIARIKTAKNIDLSDKILSMGGIVNSNGGTIKFGNTFDNTIFMSIISNL